ncbi:MAG: malto-oligosyltrehalose synthase, partial [Chloroflexota bacterium]|nr:malto-oligosyltrehalose synthase [Chloroflexota bacterium]
GNELWDFSLVDPDNRRPVDFSLRARTLQKIERLHRAHPPALRDLACSLLQAPEDGAVKLFLTHACLIARRQHPALFRDSAYAPLRSTGSKRAHICSFARWLGEETVIAVAPVLVAGLLKGRPGLPLGEVWGDTSLPLPNPRGGVYRNLLTNEAVETTPLSGKGVRLPLSQVLQSFPVALLLRAA